MVYGHVGKRVRLSRILPDGKSVIFAFDHGVEHGPADFPPEYVRPEKILLKIVDAVDAVMMLPGVARLTSEVWAGKVPVVIKVTSRTSLRPEQERLLQSPVRGGGGRCSPRG